MPLSALMTGGPESSEVMEAYVPLQPFVHQVGGHSSMLCISDSCVCKPLVLRELCFYQDMPQPLREFTPQFIGLLRVEWVSNNDGCLMPVALKKSAVISSISERSTSQPSLYSEVDDGPSAVLVSSDGIQYSESALSNAQHQPVSSHGLLNSPTLQQSRQRDVVEESTSCQFVVLENLAHKVGMPCILDLKMGARQHGDNATDAKRIRHTKKCLESTSGSLGLRVCGMQVYQAHTREYLYQSKYSGRRLDCDGVRMSLRQFLNTESRFHVELLVSVIDRLQKLMDAVQQLESVRFYSCSILIVYDGDPDLAMPRPISVHLIDFAHATYQGFLSDVVKHEGPDCSLLFGLQNLIDLLEELRSSPEGHLPLL